MRASEPLSAISKLLTFKDFVKLGERGVEFSVEVVDGPRFFIDFSDQFLHPAVRANRWLLKFIPKRFKKLKQIIIVADEPGDERHFRAYGFGGENSGRCRLDVGD